MPKAAAPYELFYWPTIQGRGEVVRLALEDAGVPYVDVARLPESEGGGEGALAAMLSGDGVHGLVPFAAPFLRAGELVIAQTTNILQFLGAHHDLAPAEEAGRLAVHQIDLTLADLVSEAHDTHHPIASSLYYEDQRAEAERRAGHFVRERLPRFLGWLEGVAERNGARAGWLVGHARSTADLFAFQVMTGLAYAFPHAMHRLEPKVPRLVALRDHVAARPRIAAYLASDRRLPFSEEGIFRHYPELDERRG
jgi:glutathione S-transferase